ncbi:Predicted nucleotide-binding protein containing TIR-like domain-containing protein [Paenibacillus sp. UNC496MF]|uniref:TIR domain-containing protein n=1 Tax=Paenibacillus sp. UNC496MF TaxID=1502753 RepID=UPI0008F27EFD|nr:nucleotide-binding protein [Paenibacillus sp. UNC496MF]SFJ41877.1 Predicted nucleotide-binding protein containing TIR-like domain-containing protein [Paenibacillus sp. UNC496MF]
MSDSRPKVFLGSTSEAKRLALAVTRELERIAEVTPWFAGTFQANHDAMTDLEVQADASDFAVFLFTPHDVVELRDQIMMIPRDNVVFELGLFWGRLKRERVFFVVPRSVAKARGDGSVVSEFHIPSDLNGLTYLTYDPDRTNLDAAVSTACGAIADRIAELGPYRSPAHASLLQFLIQFSADIVRDGARKYEHLYEAVRTAYDGGSVGRVSGAAVWRAEGNDGIRQVAGNVGRGKFYSFSAYQDAGEQVPLVVDVFRTSTEQAILYKGHGVGKIYLLCYPVGKELVVTVHLTGNVSTREQLEQLMDENDELMSTVHYVFGGDPA